MLAAAARTLPAPNPREGFDDPARLDAFLDAERWGAVASADIRAIHAPFRSGVTIEGYQRDPLVRAVEMTARPCWRGILRPRQARERVAG